MHVKPTFHLIPKKQRVIKYLSSSSGKIYSHCNTDLFNFEYALNYHIFAQFTSYVCIKSENAWSYLLVSALE